MSAYGLIQFESTRMHYVVDKSTEHIPRFPSSVVRHSASLPIF